MVFQGEGFKFRIVRGLLSRRSASRLRGNARVAQGLNESTSIRTRVPTNPYPIIFNNRKPLMFNQAMCKLSYTVKLLLEVTRCSISDLT